MQQVQQVRSWPQAMGKTFEEAVKIIHEDDESLTVLEIPDGSMVTMDFRLDRVRVFVNDEHIVVREPTIG